MPAGVCGWAIDTDAGLLPFVFATAFGFKRLFASELAIFNVDPIPPRGRTSASLFVFGFSIELFIEVLRDVLRDAFRLALTAGGEDELEFKLVFTLEWEDDEDEVFLLRLGAADGVLNCVLPKGSLF